MVGEKEKECRRLAAYLSARATRDALNAAETAASEALKGFPVGPMGLTPDAVKAAPEYRAAKLAYHSAFAALRCFNASFVRTFAREIAAERAAAAELRARRCGAAS